MSFYELHNCSLKMYLLLMASEKIFNKRPCQTTMLYCCEYLVIFYITDIPHKIEKMREMKKLNKWINVGTRFQSIVLETYAADTAITHLQKSVPPLQS
jgi:hypothetical protein